MKGFDLIYISATILFVGFCVGVFSFLMLEIYKEQNAFKIVKLTEEQRVYYGSQKPVYINGNFVAVYEPITSELRPPTLTDKLYYGELN
jgi:hypothetical protein